MVALARPDRPFVSREEYLECEATADTRHEYHAGVIVAMAGGSPEHNAIVFDLSTALGVQLFTGPCQAFGSDMRVYIPECDKYYYPDAVAVCGDPAYQEIKGVRSLLNPALVVEVLSDTTMTMDRGEKWLCYQSITSLTEYLVVWQDRSLVELFRRHDTGWLYTAIVGLESSVELDSIGCVLRLSDIYRRISFPSP